MKTVALAEICDFASGGTPNRADESFYAGDIPWITGADIVGDRISPRSFITDSAIAGSAARIVPSGTVLLVTRTSVGKVAVADRDLSFSQDITALVPNEEKLQRRFLVHFLRSEQSYFHRNARGATIKGITRSVVKDLQIPDLPLSEQGRIADILDKADALRANRREAIGHLDALGQSIFEELISNVEMIDWAKVEDAGKVQLGRQRAPKYQTGQHTRPYMRVANVQLDSLDLNDVLSMDFDEKDFDSYKLNVGDILLNEGQSTELVGRPAMWRNEIADCCFQNTLVRFVPDTKIITPDYALAVFLKYFNDGEFSKISSKTSNVAHLGAGRFAKMRFPIIPLRLQQKFADRMAVLERQKSKHRAQLAEFDELFLSLQDRAFKGELL